MSDLRLADKIERWTVDRLIPYARNPRTHSPDQVAQIAGSIRAFGFTNPILIDAQGQIIAGHGRLMAARKLGMVEVPVLVLDHLSETEKRAYVIADNKLALNAGWDDQLLAGELQALKLESFDLGLTGFADQEIEGLLQELEGAGDDADKDIAPALSIAPVTRMGELWLLGRHRLLCGDATRMDAIEQVLGGALADMVFTDPPYNVAYEGSATDKQQGRARPIANDDLGQGFEVFLRTACANMLAVTKGALYIAMSSSELHVLARAFREAGGHWSTFVIWAKNHFPWAVRTTSGNTSRSSMAGSRAPITSGAARATKAMSGSSIGNRPMTCTRP